MRESGNQEKLPYKAPWYKQTEGGLSARGMKAVIIGLALATTGAGAAALKIAEKDEPGNSQPAEKLSPTAVTINKLPDCDPSQTTIRVARDSVTQQYGQMVMCERNDNAYVYVNDK